MGRLAGDVIQGVKRYSGTSSRPVERKGVWGRKEVGRRRRAQGWGVRVPGKPVPRRACDGGQLTSLSELAVISDFLASA